MSKHFMDIGANVGQTFDWLATQPNNYRDHLFWLFEPSPRHFAALIEKCSEQAKKGYEIRLCPFGLGDKNELATFFEKDDAKGDSFYFNTASDHETANNHDGYSIIAATRSIVDMILGGTQDGDEIVLDIDAEGAEYAILIALTESPRAIARVRRILVEFHFIKGIECEKLKRNLIAVYDAMKLPLEVRGFVP